MTGRFRGFVLFAEMRTGSNHLEESLNALPDVASHGEAFNPVFMGAHNRTELLGIDRAARDRDPAPLLEAIWASAPIGGFRFFHDHDPRLLDAVLDDASIAKVILSRNPVDSHVSLRIASETGQWRLTNPKMAKDARIRFDGAAFDARLERIAAFRARVTGALQRTGQAPFLLDYAQIGDLGVVNGLAAFLGSAHRLESLPQRLKRQNPGGLEDKVVNHEEMVAHLEARDPFALHALPGMDPPRGPAVPRMLAAARSPLLVLPVPGGPTAALRDWLAALDGAPPRAGMTQRDLRAWLRTRRGFEAVAVLRHPLERAWATFRDGLLGGRGGAMQAARQVLARQHRVPLPDPAADGPAMRPAFAAWLRFLRDNLGGRSALPVDAAWASQVALLGGMAGMVPPTRLIREADLLEELAALAGRLGRDAPEAPVTRASLPEGLADDEVADLALAAYRRDYLVLGFRKRP